MCAFGDVVREERKESTLKNVFDNPMPEEQQVNVVGQSSVVPSAVLKSDSVQPGEGSEGSQDAAAKLMTIRPA